MIKTESLLSGILKNLGIEEGVRLARIKNNWQKIFDKPLSSHMFPSKLSEGELLINVDSPIWLQQLGYYKKEITEKLSSYSVKDVRFRLGSVSQRKKHASLPQKMKDLSSEDTSFISEVVSHITDESLQTSIRRALEKSLKSPKR